ncbi:MAG: site-specific DNA-methyltransferase [Gammaproteobacteria bacterium]
MANEIQTLLDEIPDERLKARLATVIGELKKAKKFGLVFEEHLPELLPIHNAAIRGQSRVARKDGKLTETFIILGVAEGAAMVKPEHGEGETQSIPVAELVVVKRFGEPIFPALRHVESVLRGGDAPHHTLIEADNYHALQLLEWLYARKVDCIYIDPPYNTGARDWKYNNDYVDKNDDWRHSKWLAMMHRRLRLAKRLLNPKTGVLIVTIDEHEVHHLGMLLKQIFPSAYQQMATIVINQKGVAQGRLARTEEYALFLFMPNAFLQTHHDDLLSPDQSDQKRFMTPRWEWLLRGGSNSRREDRQQLFYPIFVDPIRKAVTRIGDFLPLEKNPDLKAADDGSVAWPIRTDNSFGNWQVSPRTLRQLLALGYVRLGGFDKKRCTWTVQYLNKGTRARIDSGAIRTSDRDVVTGVVKLEYADAQARQRNVKTVWHRGKHDAGIYGSNVLRSILGDEPRFSFPKSVYAVRDATGAVVRGNPAALILDFFAGSGTTLHAVNLLNAADGGNRRCVLVTNNEVSNENAKTLLRERHSPGGVEWEQYGICQSVTFPRCKFVLNGKRDDGTELPGEYLTGQFEEQEVRRSIRSLEFATRETLGNKKAREALALAVGFAKSKVTGKETFLLAKDEKVAVLLDPSALGEFIEEGEESAENIETVYLPLPSGKAFNQAKAKLAEAWPPRTKSVEVKRPMKDGFAANLDYFRLEFLDRARVESGGSLFDLLPALWMMAGCSGELPTCDGSESMLLYPDCPFAVLVEESAIKSFLDELRKRADIDWAFLVTNDQDSFARMSERLPEHVPVTQRVHLWRNYLDNFFINADRSSPETP